MRALLALAGFVTATVLAGGCGSSTVPFHTSSSPKWAQSVPLPTADQVAVLRDGLVRAAKDNGEPHPTNGILVATRLRECSMLVFNDRPYVDKDVYYLAARGNFTVYGASRPGMSSAPPTGRFLYYAIEADPAPPAKLYEEINFGVQHQPVDLSKCGPWVSLDLGSD